MKMAMVVGVVYNLHLNFLCGFRIPGIFRNSQIDDFNEKILWWNFAMLYRLIHTDSVGGDCKIQENKG